MIDEDRVPTQEIPIIPPDDELHKYVMFDLDPEDVEFIEEMADLWEVDIKVATKLLLRDGIKHLRCVREMEKRHEQE